MGSTVLVDTSPMTSPHAQAEAVVQGCTHTHPCCGDSLATKPCHPTDADNQPGACAACLTTALQAQAKRDASLVRARQVTQEELGDDCGLHQHRLEQIAVAIESAAGLG